MVKHIFLLFKRPKGYYLQVYIISVMCLSVCILKVVNLIDKKIYNYKYVKVLNINLYKLVKIFLKERYRKMNCKPIKKCQEFPIKNVSIIFFNLYRFPLINIRVGTLGYQILSKSYSQNYSLFYKIRLETGEFARTHAQCTFLTCFQRILAS